MKVGQFHNANSQAVLSIEHRDYNFLLCELTSRYVGRDALFLRSGNL